MKLYWPAPERNKAPILDVLARVLGELGKSGVSQPVVLELSSGSGQHAAYFAEQLPNITWQPSDLDAKNLASIEAWVSELALPNLRAPLTLDVLQSDWKVADVQAIFNANMIHIAPWECCEGLIAGAARLLPRAGLLILYGPFKIAGAHTAESNAAFDASLKSRDARWGVRDLEAVSALAETAGFSLSERVPMPANNQTLVFRRTH